jgi:hypothetical protein
MIFLIVPVILNSSSCGRAAISERFDNSSRPLAWSSDYIYQPQHEFNCLLYHWPRLGHAVRSKSGHPQSKKGRPDLRIHVRTWRRLGSSARRIHHHNPSTRHSTTDGLTMGLAETLSMPIFAKVFQIDRSGNRVYQSERVKLVVGDIPPLALRLPPRLGPSVAITNLPGTSSIGRICGSTPTSCPWLKD